MISLEDRLQQLEKDFAAARIPTDEPGFYEDRQFIRCEQKDPLYINNYARFVQWREYSRPYIEKAEEMIYVVAAEIQLALKLDETIPAYAETPMVISRILEREGIWNYVVRGSLTITFPSDSGFDPVSFCSIEKPGRSKIDHGYYWVYAPPFHVVDVALQVQKYPYPVTHLLPKLVMERDTEIGMSEPWEIINPADVAEMRQAGVPLDEGLEQLVPGFHKFADDFPARIVTRDRTQIKYTPTSIFAPEESLEQFKRFQSNGRNATQIYDDQIRPRLADIK